MPKLKLNKYQISMRKLVKQEQSIRTKRRRRLRRAIVINFAEPMYSINV